MRPVDVNPPQISASATDGFVDENAPVGTKIIDQEGNPIQLGVSDPDLVSCLVMKICMLLLEPSLFQT